MPWIGLYIAEASAVSTLAMAADVFNGFRSKKLWFPCKYFSLNAASLTLLAVAMKLHMDLNTCYTRRIGSITDKEILTNVLVITIVVNMWIQTFQLHGYFHRGMMTAASIPTILMLLLLATFVSSAISLPASKRSLESKYQEMHPVAMREEGIVKRTQGFRFDKRMIDGMKIYWVMAETSNPQFVMARSVFCTTSSVICLFAVIVLQVVYIGWFMRNHKVTDGETVSVYGYYTKWILVVQSNGMLVGIIAPISRWFIAVRFKCLTTCFEISFAKELKIEEHWIQTLKYWRDSFSGLQIIDGKCRKYIHDVKWFTLTFLIGVQIMMVLFNKMLLFIPALLITPFLLCFKKLKTRCVAKVTTSNKDMRSESGGDTELNLSRFVLLLDGEPDLPQRTSTMRRHKVIEMGRKRQPQNLLQLLNRFGNFSGVREFDRLQVPSLHSQEPPNCWTLPLVTLTSIAISLPNIAINHKATQLMSSVSEGLSLVKLIEKTLDENENEQTDVGLFERLSA
ncbi:hypothetical protein Salat_0059100 [Sesamum alatum]|uniref:Uncharacterized protein n=1 Tax=Sesamum alatum TaxID=300844 RepID=A0AAE2CWL7_9LAMI|nr:hypothetical protein Salat_0059100 [Sesamum alatum]